MKKTVLAATLGFGLVPASWAVETMNTHECVSDAQAPAYQIQSASVLSAVQGKTPRTAGMNQHEQAIIVHEAMNNGSAETHQKIAEDHQKVMGNIAVNGIRPSVSSTAMNEHGRVAVAHKTMNNGQSGTHQMMAEAHRRMTSAG